MGLSVLGEKGEINKGRLDGWSENGMQNILIINRTPF